MRGFIFVQSKIKKPESVKLITEERPKSVGSEQYRAVRTNLQFSFVDKQLKTIMCTSSRQGEGKTTTIANLAVTFAQQGKKVLLIDADMRRPTIHSIFQLNNKIGITSVLTKEETIKGAIQKSNVPSLFILPSGPVPPNPSELLVSKAMKKLLKEASKKFDLVLIDTPPILAVADASILANRCDGTIIVVKSKGTEKLDLKKTKELLQQAEANVLGVVLNYKQKDNTLYYGEYYGR